MTSLNNPCQTTSVIESCDPPLSHVMCEIGHVMCKVGHVIKCINFIKYVKLVIPHYPLLT